MLQVWHYKHIERMSSLQNMFEGFEYFDNSSNLCSVSNEFWFRFHLVNCFFHGLCWNDRWQCLLCFKCESGFLGLVGISFVLIACSFTRIPSACLFVFVEYTGRRKRLKQQKPPSFEMCLNSVVSDMTFIVCIVMLRTSSTRFLSECCYTKTQRNPCHKIVIGNFSFM